MPQTQISQPYQRVLLIAGPTASGKSALALSLAQRLPNPVIINADSMQVYRDLRILTARPTPADEALCPHHLYGHIDASIAYNAAKWRDDVVACLSDGQVETFLIVGGTGLYFLALTEGLSPIPPVPDEVRRDVRQRLESEGSVALHAELDGAMSDLLSPTDSQRIARALEVLLATGRSLAEWQALPRDGGRVPKDALKFVLDPPRPWLHARIRERSSAMMHEKLFTEVFQLIARQLPADLPLMRAIGVSAVHAYLSGANSLEETTAILVKETQRYAKRQETWFRGQMPDWDRLDVSKTSVDALADQLANKV